MEKKVHKELAKTFETTDYTLIPVSIPSELNTSLNGVLSSIESEGQSLGYVYVASAPSKTAEFDFLVIFSQDLQITHAKVLIYREEYGGEIGSKRWLKQFYGKGVMDRVSPESNIDAISGATISVRSMTLAMDRLLQGMGQLQEKDVL